MGDQRNTGKEHREAAPHRLISEQAAQQPGLLKNRNKDQEGKEWNDISQSLHDRQG